VGELGIQVKPSKKARNTPRKDREERGEKRRGHIKANSQEGPGKVNQKSEQWEATK